MINGLESISRKFIVAKDTRVIVLVVCSLRPLEVQRRSNGWRGVVGLSQVYKSTGPNLNLPVDLLLLIDHGVVKRNEERARVRFDGGVL